MPLPWLLLGALTGGIAHLNAGEKNDRAKNIAEQSEEYYKQNKEKYARAKKCAETSVEKLGTRKKVVLETSIRQFLRSYGKIKHIQFNETIGIEELKEFEMTTSSFNNLLDFTNIYESKFSSAAAGTAAGALTLFALGGNVAVIGGAMSAGGAALAAGEIGAAGAALGSAVTPLATLVVPAVIFTGISANIKADENLKKAEAYSSKVDVAVEKMKTSIVKYNAIEHRTDMFNDLLNELNERFSYCVSMLDAIVLKKSKKAKKNPIKIEDFTRDELKLIALTRALAGEVKSVLDTPLLSSNGNLTEESGRIAEKIKTNIPALELKTQEIKSIDYRVKPRNVKSKLLDKDATITKSNHPLVIRNIIGGAAGLLLALFLPLNLWGSIFVFAVVAMIIGNKESKSNFLKKYKGILHQLMWLSSFAIFIFTASSLVNMSHYIIVSLIVGFVALCTAVISSEDYDNVAVASILGAVALFCAALLPYAFLHNFLGFKTAATVIIGVIYVIILLMIPIILDDEGLDDIIFIMPAKICSALISIALVICSVGGVKYNKLILKSEIVPVSEQMEEVSSADIYDIVTFGNYDWYVIAKDDNYCELICKKPVAKMVYNKGIDCDETTWNECSLRKWLNEDFYNNFTDSEKEVIMSVTVSTADNQQYGTYGGNDTEDYIFILSAEDVEYLPASVSGYKKKCWLRTPGVTQYGASIVTEDGTVDSDGGYGPFAKYGVRPVLVVNCKQ